MRRATRARTVWHRGGWIAAVLAAVGASAGHAAEPETAEPAASQPVWGPLPEFDADLERLAGLSLEELMAIQVTSVAGVERDWFKTPASITVLTAEDVRRSGHQTLAEALRLVPGMHVAHLSSSQWRVESRGFTGVATRSNKILVLIDGRTVWDPLFSGVWWDVQDVLLEDLDHIEAIRGPGATLWGANAVNGVVNVTTKSAKDTQGLYLSTAAGNNLRNLTAVRYGGQLDDHTWYRVWGKYTSYDAFDARPGFEAVVGDSGHDDWSVGRMGFRIDGDGADDTRYTLQGDAYDSFTYGGRASIPVPNANLQFEERIADGRVSGAYLLGRLTRDYADGAGWSLQTYYDRTERVSVDRFEVDRDTLDAELRHWFDWGERQSFIWGLRANYTADDTEAGGSLSLDPASRSHYTLSAFAQNTTELIDDTLFAMVGSKFEYNDYTHVEVQPSARLWWTPDDRHILWGGISRAVRVPSRLERDTLFTFSFIDEGLLAGGPPTNTFTRTGVRGDEDLDSEELIAYALGHRVRLTDDLVFDSTAFYHDYDDLIYTSALDPGPVIPFTNGGTGESYGVEAALTWRVADNWRLEAGYSYVNVHHGGPVVQFEDINTPHHMAQLRSYFDLTTAVELNGALYYVDNLPSALEESRLRVDLGVTWRVNERFDLTVWGQNLLDPHHSEASALEVPRSFYVQGTLRF